MPPPFHPDDVRKLLAACDRKADLGLRNHAIVLGLLDSGLRLAEFASLRQGDINMRSGLATVIGKGRKMRTVRFGAKARAALARWLAVGGNVDPRDSLWRLSPRGLQIMLRRLGRKAGIEPCGAHRFRRTFATLLKKGPGIYLHGLKLWYSMAWTNSRGSGPCFAGMGLTSKST